MWLPRAEYDRLVSQLESAQLALEVERAANRLAERHWANMFMRRAKTFPLPDPTVTRPVTDSTGPVEPVAEIDPGELAAMVEAGAEYGVGKDEVERLLRRERGLD